MKTDRATRRAVLAGAAALPALAMPAVAGLAATDPVFALIDAHKRARAESIAKGQESLRREDQLKKEGVPFRKIIKTCDSIGEQECKADNAALDALFRCEPTTSAGLAALLAYVVEEERAYPDGHVLIAVIATAGRAAKRLAA
jgi:hypothetical protein